MGNCAVKDSSIETNKPSTSSSSRPKNFKNKSSHLDVAENLIRQNTKDFRDVYEVIEKVGEGRTSNVSKVKKKGDSGNAEYALKEIDQSLMTPENVLAMKSEIELIRTLDHPNIIKAYETYEVLPSTLAIVMELCAGGFVAERGPYTESDVKNIIKNLISAIRYLHSKKIIHRDLQCENIMFENDSPNADVKLISFGLATQHDGPAETERVGSVYAMSPQVLEGFYSFEADMWSLGVVAFQLLSGERPFWGSNNTEVKRKIKEGEYAFDGPSWKYISKEAKEFVNNLLIVEAKFRWTPEQALKSAWLKNASSSSAGEIKQGLKSSLKSYKEAGDLKKLALHVIAHKSTSSEVFKLREAFREFDENQDGSITYKEFKAALKSQGYDKHEIDTMFRSVDADESGAIMYTEFLAATLEAQGKIEIQRMAEAFNHMDLDGDGFLTREELTQIAGEANDAEYIESLIKEADTDGDGKISFDEFSYVMSGHTSENVSKMLTMKD